MNLAGKAYFDAVAKLGENAAVSPVSRDLGEFLYQSRLTAPPTESAISRDLVFLFALQRLLWSWAWGRIISLDPVLCWKASSSVEMYFKSHWNESTEVYINIATHPKLEIWNNFKQLYIFGVLDTEVASLLEVIYLWTFLNSPPLFMSQPVSTESNYSFTDLTPSERWHVFPARQYHPRHMAVPQLRANSVDWSLAVLTAILSLLLSPSLLSCLPLGSDHSIHHPSLSSIFCLSAPEWCHYSPGLWLSSNYPISVEIQSWPILSRGLNAMLLLFIKLLFWCTNWFYVRSGWC